MKRNGFANLTLHLSHSSASGDTTRKIGNVGRVIAFGLFNHDCVPHTTSLLEPCLLENAVQCARRKIIAGLARNSDATRFACVLELTVAPTGDHKIPAIGLQEAQHFGNLHAASIAGCAKAPSAAGKHAIFPATPNL